MKKLVLADGTKVGEDDIVRAKGETGGYRRCKILWIERGGIHGTAVVTSHLTGFGTVSRKASEIKRG